MELRHRVELKVNCAKLCSSDLVWYQFWRISCGYAQPCTFGIFHIISYLHFRAARCRRRWKDYESVAKKNSAVLLWCRLVSQFYATS
jgi:hypothetical protein